jgi:hypothetical protein
MSAITVALTTLEAGDEYPQFSPPVHLRPIVEAADAELATLGGTAGAASIGMDSSSFATLPATIADAQDFADQVDAELGRANRLVPTIALNIDALPAALATISADEPFAGGAPEVYELVDVTGAAPYSVSVPGYIAIPWEVGDTPTSIRTKLAAAINGTAVAHVPAILDGGVPAAINGTHGYRAVIREQALVIQPVDLFTGAPSYQVFAGGVTISHTLGLTNTFLGAGSATTRDLSLASPMSQQAVAAAIAAVPAATKAVQQFAFGQFVPGGAGLSRALNIGGGTIPAGAIILGAGVYAAQLFNGGPNASGTVALLLDGTNILGGPLDVWLGSGSVGAESRAPAAASPVPLYRQAQSTFQVELTVDNNVALINAGVLIVWVAYV